MKTTDQGYLWRREGDHIMLIPDTEPNGEPSDDTKLTMDDLRAMARDIYESRGVLAYTISRMMDDGYAKEDQAAAEAEGVSPQAIEARELAKKLAEKLAEDIDDEMVTHLAHFDTLVLNRKPYVAASRDTRKADKELPVKAPHCITCECGEYDRPDPAARNYTVPMTQHERREGLPPQLSVTERAIMETERQLLEEARDRGHGYIYDRRPVTPPLPEPTGAFPPNDEQERTEAEGLEPPIGCKTCMECGHNMLSWTPHGQFCSLYVVPK